MKRFLAEILIQYFYDSHGSSVASSDAKTDPLPRWLRSWIRADSHLEKFELSFRQLEERLVSQADRHVANGSLSRDGALFSTLASSSESKRLSNMSIAAMALAAGLACVMLAAGWSLWKPTSGSQNGSEIANHDETQGTRSQQGTYATTESVPREQIVRSTWEATKRLAAEMKQKSGQANLAMMLVEQRALDKPFRDAGGELLRFVAQKLPQATVRMLGMNAREGI